MIDDQGRWVILEGRDIEGEVAWEAAGSVAGIAKASEAVDVATKRWRDLTPHGHIRAVPWTEAKQSDRELASQEDAIRREEYGRAINVSVASLMLRVASLLYDELQTAGSLVRAYGRASGLDDVGVRARLQHYYLLLTHHWITREVERELPDWLLADVLAAVEVDVDRLHEFDVLTGATPTDMAIVRAGVAALRAEFEEEFGKLDLPEAGCSLHGTLFWEFARRLASLFETEENEVVDGLMVHSKTCMDRLRVAEHFGEIRLLLPGVG